MLVEDNVLAPDNPDNPDNLDIAFGIAVTPEYMCQLKEENEWIELSEGVFLQKAD